MKAIFLLLVFAILVFRGGPILPSLVVAVILTVILGIALHVLGRAIRKPRDDHQPRRIPAPPPAKRGRSSRRKSAPKIRDGDIGPYVKHMLEHGDPEAAARCIVESVPGSWAPRADILKLVEEQGRLQRSIRIARLAGVPMPDEADSVAAEQVELIADRARRMAFIHLHGTMNPRIAQSLTRLVAGTEPLIVLSATLRADLAESTANPQWGAQQERELLRKLERMSNTLQAMNTGLDTDGALDAPADPKAVASVGAGS